MEAVKKFLIFSLHITIPNKHVLIVATGISWHSMQVTFTDGHIFTRNIVISKTVKFVRNESIGNFIGKYVIAPLSALHIVLSAANMVAMVTALVTILVLNTLCYYYYQWAKCFEDIPSSTQRKDEK